MKISILAYEVFGNKTATWPVLRDISSASECAIVLKTLEWLGEYLYNPKCTFDLFFSFIKGLENYIDFPSIIIIILMMIMIMIIIIHFLYFCNVTHYLK